MKAALSILRFIAGAIGVAGCLAAVVLFYLLWTRHPQGPPSVVMWVIGFGVDVLQLVPALGLPLAYFLGNEGGLHPKAERALRIAALVWTPIALFLLVVAGYLIAYFA